MKRENHNALIFQVLYIREYSKGGWVHFARLLFLGKADKYQKFVLVICLGLRSYNHGGLCRALFGLEVVVYHCQLLACWVQRVKILSCHNNKM